MSASPIRRLRDARFALASDRRGGGAVEFALVLPLFIALVVGAFEFGWTQHCLSSIRFELERSSRILMVNPQMTEAQLETLVRSKLTAIADNDVEVDLNVTDTANGRIAVLTGTYRHAIGVPQLLTYPVNYSTSVTTVLPAA